MRIEARRATAADVPEIAAIAVALANEIRDERGGAVHLAEQRSIVDTHLRSLSSSTVPAAADAFVVELDHCTVGFALLRIVELHDVRVGVIDAYGVLVDARGVGAGEELLGAVLERAKAAGCVGVDADALPGARATKNFFETFGFTARRLVVHHRFDGAGLDDSSADEREA